MRNVQFTFKTFYHNEHKFHFSAYQVKSLYKLNLDLSAFARLNNNQVHHLEFPILSQSITIKSFIPSISAIKQQPLSRETFTIPVYHLVHCSVYLHKFMLELLTNFYRRCALFVVVVSLLNFSFWYLTKIKNNSLRESCVLFTSASLSHFVCLGKNKIIESKH